MTKLNWERFRSEFRDRQESHESATRHEDYRTDLDRVPLSAPPVDAPNQRQIPADRIRQLTSDQLEQIACADLALIERAVMERISWNRLKRSDEDLGAVRQGLRLSSQPSGHRQDGSLDPDLVLVADLFFKPMPLAVLTSAQHANLMDGIRMGFGIERPTLDRFLGEAWFVDVVKLRYWESPGTIAQMVRQLPLPQAEYFRQYLS